MCINKSYDCKNCPNQIHNVDPLKVKEVAKAAVNIQVNGEDIKRAYGCGRVYVSFLKLRKTSKQAKALESVGFNITRRPHSTQYHIYVGYDNATGRQLAYGKKLAKHFNDNDICCYCDGDDD